VTAGTLHKRLVLFPDEHRAYLEEKLLSTLENNRWVVQAWAVLANHYHFLAEASEAATPLKPMLRDMHSETARELNRMDNAVGRTVWYQYWETPITFETSWLARLNYIHQNAVHHGLVREATQYPYCSAAWFEREANPGLCRAVKSTSIDRIKVRDDF
jgi:putative transposase